MTPFLFVIVYNAVGLAAYELFDSVDFDVWFKNQLLAELQVNHNRYCYHPTNVRDTIIVSH